MAIPWKGRSGSTNNIAVIDILTDRQQNTGTGTELRRLRGVGWRRRPRFFGAPVIHIPSVYMVALVPVDGSVKISITPHLPEGGVIEPLWRPLGINI